MTLRQRLEEAMVCPAFHYWAAGDRTQTPPDCTCSDRRHETD